MKILSKNELKNYKNLKNFIIKENDSYSGFFYKKDNTIKSYGRVVSISIDNLLEKNEKLLLNALRFKHKNTLRKAVLKVYRKDEKLVFELYILSPVRSRKIYEETNFSFSITEEIKRLLNSNLLNLKGNAWTLIEALVPKTILSNLQNLGIILLDTEDEINFIPFELLFDKYNIIFKRIKNSNEKKDLYIKNILILANGWDRKFSYTVEEGKMITEFFSKKFIIDLISHSLSIKEFFSLSENSDMLYISSHADERGIDLGNFFLDQEIIRNLPNTPKFVFINTCFFNEIENLAEEFIKKGTNSLICSYFKIPDSFQTKFFVENFFFTFSKTFDIDLSLYIAMKNSYRHKYYNHYLYRVFV